MGPGSEPGPVLCPGGQEPEVWIWRTHSNPEDPGQTVTRPVKEGRGPVVVFKNKADYLERVSHLELICRKWIWTLPT